MFQPHFSLQYQSCCHHYPKTDHFLFVLKRANQNAGSQPRKFVQIWYRYIRDPEKDWRNYFHLISNHSLNATCRMVCNSGSPVFAPCWASLFVFCCCCAATPCCCSCTMLAMAAETWGARFGLTGRPAIDGNGCTLDADGCIAWPGSPNIGMVFLPGIPRPCGGVPGIIEQGKWAPGMDGNGTAAVLFMSKTPIPYPNPMLRWGKWAIGGICKCCMVGGSSIGGMHSPLPMDIICVPKEKHTSCQCTCICICLKESCCIWNLVVAGYLNLKLKGFEVLNCFVQHWGFVNLQKGNTFVVSKCLGTKRWMR